MTCNQDNNRISLRFNLKTALYIVSLIAAGLAVSLHSIWFTCIVLLGWWFISLELHSTNNVNWMLIGLIALAYFVLLPFTMIPDSMYVRASYPRSFCSNNMRYLGIALWNHENAYGELPAPVTEIGGNEHSWRVILLPHLEEESLYERYDFSQAWDSKQNLRLANTPPGILECSGNTQNSKTPYKLVVGPGTLFESGTAKLSDATDGLKNTIILIGDHSNHVFWSEPSDILIDDAVDLICGREQDNDAQPYTHYYDDFLVGSYKGIHVVFADGSIGHIGSNAHPTDVRRAFLCADGHPVSTNLKEELKFGRGIRYQRIGFQVALVIYVLLLGVPAYYIVKQSQFQTSMRQNSCSSQHGS